MKTIWELEQYLIKRGRANGSSEVIFVRTSTGKFAMEVDGRSGPVCSSLDGAITSLFEELQKDLNTPPARYACSVCQDMGKTWTAYGYVPCSCKTKAP